MTKSDKPRNPQRRLRLAGETLRQLTASELPNVVGGDVTTTVKTITLTTTGG